MEIIVGFADIFVYIHLVYKNCGHNNSGRLKKIGKEIKKKWTEQKKAAAISFMRT